MRYVEYLTKPAPIWERFFENVIDALVALVFAYVLLWAALVVSFIGALVWFCRWLAQ